MKTFENRDWADGPPRSHPWTTSAVDERDHYVDFRARPELIPTALEDFRPWERHPAVGAFYELVGWLNGPGSTLESNDCAFAGPEANAHQDFAKRLVCTGRIGVLYRELAANTDERAIRRLIKRLHVQLAALEPALAWGAIGTTRLAVDYRGLPAGASLGAQVLVSFWAWGDDEAEVFAHLARVFAALRAALLAIARAA